MKNNLRERLEDLNKLGIMQSNKLTNKLSNLLSKKQSLSLEQEEELSQQYQLFLEEFEDNENMNIYIDKIIKNIKKDDKELGEFQPISRFDEQRINLGTNKDAAHYAEETFVNTFGAAALAKIVASIRS